MKALTILQPWAWLICAGHKDIENRVWRAPSWIIGKRIVIHAGMKDDPEADYWARFMAERQGIEIPPKDELQWRAAIGTAVVQDIVEEHPSPWFIGPFGIVLRDAELWPAPVETRGALGLWDMADDRLPGGVKVR